MAADPREARAGRRGLFVVLDGVDGCGKSTQAARLARALGAEAAAAPLHLREPGSTAVGEALRKVLLTPGPALSAGVEALLFAAARRQLLEELVAPALAAGRDVVCERFHPSTFAYQAVAGGLDEERVLALLGGWAGTPEPDLVVLLELDAEEAARRADARGGEADRMEGKGLEFQRAVARGYARWAERAERAGRPRVARLDARGTPDELARRIAEEVRRARA